MGAACMGATPRPAEEQEGESGSLTPLHLAPLAAEPAAEPATKPVAAGHRIAVVWLRSSGHVSTASMWRKSEAASSRCAYVHGAAASMHKLYRRVATSAHRVE